LHGQVALVQTLAAE